MQTRRNDTDLRPEVEDDVAGLTRLMSEHGLRLVDWCRVQPVEAEEDKVTEYLRTWCRYAG
jgi:hypothetical protein